jgi:RNA polymerase sigma-70 factor (ECF subfamily)
VRADVSPPDADERFALERPRLVSLAYRMTGTADDAEDVVQDVWLRWQGADHGSIDNPAGWLTTVTTRLAIDRLTSARARREVYVGPWLPEPWVPAADAPDAAAVETLTLGFLRVLETLAPVERAVFLLHDVFGYPFAEVAATVERSEPATRQIAKRARDRVRDGRPRLEPDPEDAERLAGAFLAAVVEGDLDALTGLLTEDVVSISDGGPDHRAARRPVVGQGRVARLLTNLATRFGPTDELHPVEVHGQPGWYVLRDGRPFNLMVFTWRDGRVAEILAIVNPDKMRRFHDAWTATR